MYQVKSADKYNAASKRTKFQEKGTCWSLMIRKNLWNAEKEWDAYEQTHAYT